MLHSRGLLAEVSTWGLGSCTDDYPCVCWTAAEGRGAGSWHSAPKSSYSRWEGASLLSQEGLGADGCGLLGSCLPGCSGHRRQRVSLLWCREGARHRKQSWCKVPGHCAWLCVGGWAKGMLESNRQREWKRQIPSVLLGWQNAEKCILLSLQKIV